MLKYHATSALTKLAISLSWLLTLGACSISSTNDIAQYQATAFQWSDALAAATNVEALPDSQWWQSFNDPQLNELIEDAVLGNLDLEQARERVIEARRVADLNTVNFNPKFGLSSSVTDQRQSLNSVFPVGQIPNFNADNTIYSFGFDAAWELDFFGRKNIVHDIGVLEIESREESKHDLLVSLVAEVARTYFDLVQAQQEMQTLESSIAYQAELVELVRLKRDFGEASNVELENTKLLLIDYEARAPEIAGRVRGNSMRLSILLGQPPSAAVIELDNITTAITSPNVPAVGMTSDLLRRRPDVRRAERSYLLAARQADFTRVSTYPQFSLFGNVGPETIDISNLFNSSSIAFALGAMLNWDLYDGGRDDAEAKVSESKLRQSEIAYRQSVLTALEDVEAAVSSYVALHEAVNKRQALAQAQRRLVQIMRERYEAGTGTVLEVLDAQRNLGDAEIAESRATANQATSIIGLYKALGGGWETFELVTSR